MRKNSVRMWIAILTIALLATAFCIGLVACSDKEGGDPNKNNQNIEEFEFVLGEDNNYWLKSYRGSGSEVVVPSEYKGTPVTRISTYAFYGYQFPGCNNIKTITIPDSVTLIEQDAFRDCDKLETINIGKGVQTIQGQGYKIDSFAINSCDALKSINVAEDNAVYQSKDGVLYKKADKSIIFVPFSIEGAVTILDGCVDIDRDFQGRQNLEEITIPESVTSIAELSFGYCNSLNTVNWNAANCALTDDCYHNPVFSECVSLTTVNIGENVTSIEAETFNGCHNLKTVNWNAIECAVVPRITGSFHLYEVFDNCTSLDAVNIGSKVKTIPSRIFSGCDRLLSVAIPDNVETIETDAFYDCEMLREITIGKGVTTIESGVFNCCYHLVHIRNLSNVTLSDMHWGSYIKGEKAEVLTSEAGEFRNKLEHDENGIWTYTFDDGYASTVYAFDYDGDSTDLDLSLNSKINAIYPYAFYMRDDIMSVKIGAGVTTLGKLSFYMCNNLTTVTILGDARDTEDVSKAFAECHIQTATATAVSIAAIPNKYLTKAMITEGELDVNNRNTGLRSCYALRELTIGEGVTNIGEQAFSGLYHLVHIRNLSGVSVERLVGDDAEVITNETDEFKNKIELDENGVWTYTVGNKVYAYDCEEYTYELDLSKNSKINAIYPGAFYKRSYLNSVIIPNTVTEIGSNAFAQSGLQSIDIPDSVQTIGIAAFFSCEYLTTVKIGAGVTRIETNAFNGQNQLESVTFANPNGWYRTYSSTNDNGESVSATTLQDPSSAAQYFEDQLGVYSLYRI